MLINPNDKAAETEIQELRQPAGERGIQLKILEAGIEGDFEADFALLAKHHVAGLLVSADPFFDAWRERLVSLAAQYAIPAVYGWREFVELGGLISYGPRMTAIWRQAGMFAGKILKGAKLADLPVQQPTKFELTINLNTAKALGLSDPACDPLPRRRGD